MRNEATAPMRNPHKHLTDEQVTLLADGELSGSEIRFALTHLDSCWSCRERMGSLENAIAAFIRQRHDATEDKLLPHAGPRALLRARMADIASVRTTGRRRNWASLVQRFGLGILESRVRSIAICLGILAATLVLFQFTVNAEGPRPNARVTPGETRPITLAEVCSNPRAEVVVSHISLKTQRQVLGIYGLRDAPPEKFEVDYLITPDLGGAETVRNLWPQPYSTRWNAKVKDRLEQRLHDLVCSGRIDLQTAQREIAVDWIGAYKKYVGANY